MKKNIALVTGGFSGEAVISYKSAATIGNNLDPEQFNIYKIDVNPNGWFYEMVDGRKVEIDKNDFSLQLDNRKIDFDAVFIGMHGTPGEDGKLQGYFDTLKIPYTSCDAATSAITFNKRYTVAVAKNGRYSSSELRPFIQTYSGTGFAGSSAIENAGVCKTQ